MKIPEREPPLPRLRIVTARWQAVCGRCLATSRTVEASSARAAWNEIAAAEGWSAYEPPPLSGMTAEPYPVCLRCAERELEEQEHPLPKLRHRRR